MLPRRRRKVPSHGRRAFPAVRIPGGVPRRHLPPRPARTDAEALITQQLAPRPRRQRVAANQQPAIQNPAPQAVIGPPAGVQPQVILQAYNPNPHDVANVPPGGAADATGISSQDEDSNRQDSSSPPQRDPAPLEEDEIELNEDEDEKLSPEQRRRAERQDRKNLEHRRIKDMGTKTGKRGDEKDIHRTNEVLGCEIAVEVESYSCSRKWWLWWGGVIREASR